MPLPPSAALSAPERLADLKNLYLLDSPAEEAFDRISRLAARLVNAPVCLVSLVDNRRQFFKSAFGLGGEAGQKRETPLTHSFCQHVVISQAPLVVNDAPRHPIVCDNLAIPDLGVQAYLGVPLRSPNGSVLGSFCVIDGQPRVWTDEEIHVVTELASQVDTLIALKSEALARRRSEVELKTISVLKESEYSLNRSILEGTVYSVIETNPQGVIQVFNRGAEQMLGYRREEVVGKLTPAVIHDPSEVATRAGSLSEELGRSIEPGFEVFVAKAKLGEPEEREWTYIRKDGSRLPVRLSVTVLRDHSQEIIGYLGIARDLTEYKRAEAGRAELLARLKKIGREVPGMIYQFRLRPDGTSCFPYTSEAIQSIYGVTPEDVRDDAGKILDALHPDDLPHVWQTIVDSAQTLKPWSLEYRVRDRDGKVRWLHGHSNPEREPDGSVLWHGYISDVTERKSNAVFFETLARISPIGIFRTDPNGECLYVNERWSAITGLPSELALGKGWSSALHPDDGERVFSSWKKCAESKIPFSLEYRFQRPNGEISWVIGRAQAELTPAGEVIGYVGSIEDITQQKRIAEDLLHAKDAAESANRAKSNFLAAMSHEIRTPMNGIIGMSSLLAESPLEAEYKRYIGVIENSGQSLLRIIDDILDFSKIEAGRMNIVSGEFNLADVFREVRSLLTPQANRKSIALDLLLDPDVDVGLRGDSGRIRQITLNLVGNAVKFTEKGSVTLSARLRERTKTSLRVRVEVKDTGIGIPESAFKYLFQPFSQVESGDARRFGGTGLGLAISRQLVELMGGTIDVESTPGQGTCFGFELSLEILPSVENDATVASRAAIEKSPAPASNAESLRLLVVDDNQSNQLLTRLLLEKNGHVVEGVEGGEAALRRLAVQKYDVVLMDCQMPGLDGFETTRQIRSGTLVGVDPQVYIIALTAYALSGDRERCLASGMNDYLSKPLVLNQLREALTKVVRTSGVKKNSAVENSGRVEPSFDPVPLLRSRALAGLDGRQFSEKKVHELIDRLPTSLLELAGHLRRKEAGAALSLTRELRELAAQVGGVSLVKGLLEVEAAAGRQDWTAANEQVIAAHRLWPSLEQELLRECARV